MDALCFTDVLPCWFRLFWMQADLAKGVSGVLYIRGVYWTAPRPLSGRVPDDPKCAALKVPFCVFQKTIGDTVPDVLKSKIGLRSVVCLAVQFRISGNWHSIRLGPPFPPSTLHRNHRAVCLVIVFKPLPCRCIDATAQISKSQRPVFHGAAAWQRRHA